jgi:hypothetical protein
VSDKPTAEEVAAQKAAIERNRYALDQIGRLLAKADEFWATLSAADQNIINSVHNDEAQIGHCIRWGLTASCELDDLAPPDRALACETVISFVHEGVEITNPFMSSCGRFEVDPRTYGFKEEDRADGFRALVLRFKDGHIMLTDEGGRQPPEGVQDCMIKLYCGDCELLACRAMTRQIELADKKNLAIGLAELVGDEPPQHDTHRP